MLRFPSLPMIIIVTKKIIIIIIIILVTIKLILITPWRYPPYSLKRLMYFVIESITDYKSLSLLS